MKSISEAASSHHSAWVPIFSHHEVRLVLCQPENEHAAPLNFVLPSQNPLALCLYSTHCCSSRHPIACHHPLLQTYHTEPNHCLKHPSIFSDCQDWAHYICFHFPPNVTFLGLSWNTCITLKNVGKPEFPHTDFDQYIYWQAT